MRKEIGQVSSPVICGFFGRCKNSILYHSIVWVTQHENEARGKTIHTGNAWEDRRCTDTLMDYRVANFFGGLCFRFP